VRRPLKLSKCGSRGPLLQAMPFVLVCMVTVSYAQHPGERPDDYPNRPIRMLVGNAPGGGVDITARIGGRSISPSDWPFHRGRQSPGCQRHRCDGSCSAGHRGWLYAPGVGRKLVGKRNGAKRSCATMCARHLHRSRNSIRYVTCCSSMPRYGQLGQGSDRLCQEQTECAELRFVGGGASGHLGGELLSSHGRVQDVCTCERT